MAAEYQRNGEFRYAALLPQLHSHFAGYLEQLALDAAGIGLPEGYVPQTTFWSVVEDEIVGVIRIRHYLTPWLEQEGGHIGYEIRPSYRGKGYGKRQLQLALEKLREWGWSKVLITCDENNAASARVIEANGGKLENIIILPDNDLPVRRYWITLSQPV
jgi:predicted acetyltransferase